MRVIDGFGFPILNILRLSPDGDPQLFVQFAAQRIMNRLTGFHLATGELPIPGVGLAGRTCCEQKRRIGPEQNPNSHLHQGAIHAALPGQIAIGDQHLAHPESGRQVMAAGVIARKLPSHAPTA